MKQHSKFAQWLAFGLLGLWGGISFLVIVSEEKPQRPLSIDTLILIKGAALISFLLCILVGCWLNSKGLLPEVKE